MNFFDKNLPVPVVPVMHNVLAAIVAFGCAAAVLTGQSIALAEVPAVSQAQAMRMADVVTMPEETIRVTAKPAMVCRDDGTGRTCETARGWAEREEHRRVNTVGPKGWR